MPVARAIKAGMSMSAALWPGGTWVGMKNHLSPWSIGPITLGTSALTCQYMIAGPWRWACASPGARNTMLKLRDRPCSPTILAPMAWRTPLRAPSAPTR